MNAAVVKKTQETLGKVIKKPPLMEKLLSKPPFRYLHDIFMEVIRTTGFMKGLYEENEMKSDNVNGKEARMAFLQKAIDVVALVSGEPLMAKPARIVAGHEPEKTNELLQAIGKCCLNKLSSDEAVKQVLSKGKVDPKSKTGSSKSQEKSQEKSKDKSQDKRHKEERSHDPDAEGKKRLTERSSSREEKDTVKPKDRQHKSEQKERRSDREHSDRRHRSDQKPHATDTEKSRDPERERDKERENGRSRDKEKERTRDRQRTRDSHRDGDKGNHKEKDRERQNGKGEQSKLTGRGDKKASNPEELQQKPNSDELSNHTAKSVPPEQNPEEEPTEVVGCQPDSPVRIPRPSSAKGQRRRPKMGDESDSDGDDDPHFAQTSHPQENGNPVGSSMPSDINSSRQMTRPGSARPAPLRVRRQESHTEAPPPERLSSAKPRAPVIMDGKKMSDDEEEDDEQFLVEEVPPPPPSAPENDREPAPELDSEEEHGGLVKKILEVKKNHELPLSSLKSKEQSLVSEAALLKKREMVTKEVEKLRSFIQGLCRNYQFLAKIMEYTLEDMDAMRAEVQHWRKENKECAEALLQEQRETERVVEPLKAELEELEQQIKDQQDQHYSLKANVLKNEELIQKMLTGAFHKK